MPETYLRHPSKKSAVLLLVLFSLGLIITWLQGNTRNSKGMRRLQMVVWWSMYPGAQGLQDNGPPETLCLSRDN
jgi:hypothetical protein